MPVNSIGSEPTTSRSQCCPQDGNDRSPSQIVTTLLQTEPKPLSANQLRFNAESKPLPADQLRFNAESKPLPADEMPGSRLVIHNTADVIIDITAGKIAELDSTLYKSDSCLSTRLRKTIQSIIEKVLRFIAQLLHDHVDMVIAPLLKCFISIDGVHPNVAAGVTYFTPVDLLHHGINLVFGSLLKSLAPADEPFDDFIPEEALDAIYDKDCTTELWTTTFPDKKAS